MTVLRRRWHVIAICVLVAASAAWIVTEATSEQAPLPPGSSTTFGATVLLWDPGTEATGAQGPVTSPAALAQVVKGPNVAPIAAEIMYFQGDPAALLPRVRADVDPSTGYLRITGFGADSASAQTTADAFSQGLIVYLTRLQATKIEQERHALQERIASLTESGAGPAATQELRDRLAQLSVKGATPVSLTVLQRQPPTPRPLAAGVADAVTVSRLWVPETVGSRVLLASLIGLLVGIVLALLLERFDPRIRSSARAEEAFRLPVLAEVPTIPVGRRERVVTATHPYSRAANAFRLVQVGSARWAAPEGRPEGRKVGPKNGRKNGKSAPHRATTILVTSAEARDGKTTVAANLAAAYAQAGNRVLVVSCDLRRPAIHEMFGVAEEPGLTDLLRSMESDAASADPASYLKPCAVLRVAVLPSGGTTDRPSELLGSDAMRRLAKRLKKITDVVILDSAPLVVAGDVVPLISMADGVVVVARAGTTRRDVADSATTLLERSGLRTGCVVLNDAREFSIPLAKRRMYQPARKVRKAAEAQPQRDEDWLPKPAIEPPVVDEPAPVTSPPTSVEEAQVPSEPDDVVRIPDLPETSDEQVEMRSPGISASASGGLQALRDELAALREELVSVQIDPDQPSQEPSRSLPIGFRPGSDRSG